MKPQAYRSNLNLKSIPWGPIGSFALGAAIGSVSALLFAPASGKVTRRRIGTQVKQAQRFLTKKAGYLKEAATEKLGETREWLVDHVIPSNGKQPLRHRIVSHS